MNDRFNLINQPLLNLFNIEMKIYENFSSKYKTYRDLEDKLSKMRTLYAQKDRRLKYDPSSFLKNPYLDSKFKQNTKEKIYTPFNPKIEIPQIEDFKEISNNFSKTNDKSDFPVAVNSKVNILQDQNINDFFNYEEINFNTVKKNKNEEFIFENPEDFHQEGNYIKTSENQFRVSEKSDIFEESEKDKNCKFNYPSLRSILDQHPNSKKHTDILNSQSNYFQSNFSRNPTSGISAGGSLNKPPVTKHFETPEPNKNNSIQNLEELFSNKKITSLPNNTNLDNNPNTIKLIDPFSGFY